MTSMSKRSATIIVLAVVSFGFSSLMLTYACGQSYETVRKATPAVDACAPVRSFDFKIRSSWERDGKIDSEVFWEYSKQDENYYGRSTIPNEGPFEIMSVKGKFPYIRPPGGEWHVPLEEKEENLPFPWNLENPCPDLSRFDFVKVETVNGVHTTHHAMPTVTTIYHSRPDSGKPITVAAWEYWVDRDGVIVKAKNYTDTFVVGIKLMEVVTFSGFGEFNIIEDPMPDGTPTPVPNDTPLPTPTP